MQRPTIVALVVCSLELLTCSKAGAWNALGHKVVADIAWEQLTPERRRRSSQTLRRHPRFDEDFAKGMPADVDEDRWIFQHAAIWPDIARGFKGEDRQTYNHGNVALRQLSGVHRRRAAAADVQSSSTTPARDSISASGTSCRR